MIKNKINENKSTQQLHNWLLIYHFIKILSTYAICKELDIEVFEECMGVEDIVIWIVM